MRSESGIMSRQSCFKFRLSRFEFTNAVNKTADKFVGFVFRQNVFFQVGSNGADRPDIESVGKRDAASACHSFRRSLAIGQ